MSERDNSWHLDKRVPIALIFTLLIQTAGALMWAGAASERLHQLEQRQRDGRDLSERTARLEEQAHHMRAALGRIEDKLDQIMTR